MSSPRVSFVVPTRNQAPFLRRCIDSCLAQGIPESEIVVVDGLSTDGTQEILRSYGDRITWTSEPDGGQADAINKGIAHARGDVIAWINSDDYYPGQGVLAAVLAAFETDPRVDVVYGRALTVDGHGRPIRPHRTRPIASPKDVLLQPTGPAMQPAIFFRRSLFHEVGGLRVDLHYAMDYDLWLRMFARARAIRFLDRVLACATFHEGAKSIAGMRKQIVELMTIKRLHAPSFELGWSDRVRLLAGTTSLWAYWLAVRAGLRKAT